MSSPSDTSPAPSVVRITGAHSNVGKTTLIELLIPLLIARGRRVGTIKHTHHGFELDHQGKDSHRHGVAGAVATVLIGPHDAAVLVRESPRMELDTAIDHLRGRVDIVLAEGFRGATTYAIVLDQTAGGRIEISDDAVVVSVMPDELTSSELHQLVEICERGGAGNT